MKIERTSTTNYIEFDGTRMTLNVEAEHKLMTAFKYGEYQQFRDAKDVLWEVNPDGEGEFTLAAHGGPVTATITGQDLTDLIHDLRAIIMGA